MAQAKGSCRFKILCCKLPKLWIAFLVESGSIKPTSQLPLFQLLERVVSAKDNSCYRYASVLLAKVVGLDLVRNILDAI